MDSRFCGQTQFNPKDFEQISNPANEAGQGAQQLLADTQQDPQEIPAHQTGDIALDLQHSIIRLGAIHVQVFAIYGLTQSIPQATDQTEAILAEAIARAKQLNLPCIIAGDFNMPIQESEVCQQLYEEGFQHLEALHQVLHGHPMPKTCYEAAIPDSAIISPCLVPYLKKIQVNKDKLFDCHDPVVITFDLPDTQMFQTCIRMPKPWTQLPIDASALQELTDQHGWPECQTIPEWCQTAEYFVDCVILTQHARDPANCPLAQVPRAFKGRGQHVAPKKFPLQTQVKKGRQGDYEPPGEVYAINTKRKVTQLRRIQSLRRQLQKRPLTPACPLSRQEQLQLEWNAIVYNKSFSPSFAHWAQQTPEIGPLPTSIPDVDFLLTMEQILQFEVDAKIRSDATIRNKP